MRILRTFLSFVMAILLGVQIVPMDQLAYAESRSSQTIITVENKTISPGETFSVDISMRNNPGIVGATLGIAYDDNLTLLDVSAGEAFSYMTFTKPGKYVSPCKFNWDVADIENPSILHDGVILTLSFKASDSVKSDQKLPITLDISDGFYDNNLNDVSVGLKME